MKLALRTSAARALVWLVVGLTPLQSMAGAVLATLGPAHVHNAPAAVERELEDVRRAAPRSAANGDRHRALFGHTHAATPARHRHAASDATVLAFADDASRQRGADGDELGASPAIGAIALPVPDVVAWRDPSRATGPVAARTWSPLTDDPEPLERPPRDA